MLVIHENRGLTDHIRSIPPRFAADGYSTLAVDLLSEEGGTETLGGDAQAIGALGAAPVERMVADMRSGIDELQRRVPNQKIGMIGFCFGGGMTWTLLAAGEPRLAAAAPFYGPTPANPDFSGSKAAVLAVYGALDARVNGTRDAAVAALQAAGLDLRGEGVPGREPRVLQRHRCELQRRRRDAGVRGGARLVRPLPRVSPARAHSSLSAGGRDTERRPSSSGSRWNGYRSFLDAEDLNPRGVRLALDRHEVREPDRRAEPVPEILNLVIVTFVPFGTPASSAPCRGAVCVYSTSKRHGPCRVRARCTRRSVVR